MERKIKIISIFIVLCFVGFAWVPAHADTVTITKDWAFIDNRPADDPFQSGLILNLDVIATDTGGSGALTGPGSSRKGDSNNPSFPIAGQFNLNINAVFPIIGGAEFTRFFPIETSDFPNVVGTYTYTITNMYGDSATSTSHSLSLEKLEVIPIPTNLAFSDHSTTPVFSFTDPEDPTLIPNGVNRKYLVGIFDDTVTSIYESPVLPTPSFTVPEGILQPGKAYYFRAHSMDFDPADYDASGHHSNLENRAIKWTTFQTTSTAVPEPSTMLLLGSGLIVLWGFRRKFKK
jgi:hypothetical protein